MTGPTMQRVVVGSAEEAAATLREADTRRLRVRFTGGGTKLAWGGAIAEPDIEVCTAGLDRILEHNVGDLTAVVEAGVPLVRLQAELASAGQMLAVDPPTTGPGGGGTSQATVGGIFATADSGPLRHRFGASRDLVLGVTIALADGTVAKSGGKVIKNVAGYDLGKLYAGSFGTLGLITRLAIRLHPRPQRTATAVGRTQDPRALARAVPALANAPLEHLCLDVAWSSGEGTVLARFGGVTDIEQAGAALGVLREAGLETSPAFGDDVLWKRQRSAQRSPEGVIVRVSAVRRDLPRVLRAVDLARGSLVGRAASGLFWVRLPDAPAGQLADAIVALREALAPATCLVLDAPAEVRAEIDPWPEHSPALLELSRRLKRRFDPRGTCNPGVFVGDI
jgi:glycolate oxidase FAD binding subunit